MKIYNTLLIVPTYNEKENIKIFIKRLMSISTKVDVLFIDDNSTDGTNQQIKSMINKQKNMSIIIRNKKLGIGDAHLFGIMHAYKNKYEKLITIDADLTHYPEDIPRFIRKSKSYDIVVGSRFLRKDSLKDWSFIRKILTHLVNILTNVFLKLPFDSTSGFRIYNLKKIDKELFMNVKSRSYSFFFESLFFLARNNNSIGQLKILLPKRTYGSSKMKVIDLFKSLYRLAVLNFKYLIIKKKIKKKNTFLVNKKIIPDYINDWEIYWKEENNSLSEYFYNVIAYFYRVIIIKPALNHFIRKILDKNNNYSVLHAGCGSGQVDMDLEKVCKLTALDLSPKALEKYQRHHNLNTNLVHGDIAKLPFKEETFDVVFNLGVMEHFSEKEIDVILREFKRVLKKNGFVVLFWPPRYGVSVIFFKLLKKIFKILLRKNVEFHPKEITHIKSKKHSIKILEKSNLLIIESYFGIRDFFTHQIITAKKV